MSVVTKAALKAYFETGDFPTQDQFGELIDNIPEWAEVSLTAAQIKTGNSIPIEAIAAPGIGKVIEVLSGAVKFNYNTAAFTSTRLRLQTDTASTFQFGTSSILDEVLSIFTKMTPTADVVTQFVENKKLTIVADADSAVGDGTAKIYILYRIITL